MIIIRYILPSIVIVTAFISVFILGSSYRKQPQLHRLRSTEFILHTLASMLLICVVGMLVVMHGGFEYIFAYYEIIHGFVEKSRLALPITMSLITTIAGILITFVLIHPRITIYPLAAYETNQKREYWLTFLVQNIGLTECIDMKVDLYECEFQETGKDADKKMNPITLEPLSQSSVIGWGVGHLNDNSYLVETKGKQFKKNLFASSDHFLELRIKLTHPISRITKVFIQHYYPTDIHHGRFVEDRLVRFPIEDHQKLLPKEALFFAARCLRIIEITCAAILCVGTFVFIVVKPTDIMCWSCAFNIVAIVTAVMELIRQYVRRPINANKKDSNI